MNIEQAYREGRIIRHQWSGIDADGRELLCLYTALVGDPDALPADCPAELCPRWLAHLLPWLDDAPSESAWPGIVERVVRLAPRLASVPPETEWTVRSLCVREAMGHTGDDRVLAVCERVASLCERRAAGEHVDDADLRAAAADAAASAADAATAAADAATAATWAASPWEWMAATAVAWATRAASESDRLADAILSAIEAAVGVEP